MARQKKKAPPAPPAMARRVMLSVAIILVGGLLLRAVLPQKARSRPSADQILEKKVWTEEEVTTGLSQAYQFDFDHHNQRKEAMIHLRRQLDSMSPEDQRRIQAAAMREAMHRNLAQFRAMNPDQRSHWLKTLDERAPEHLRRLVEAEGLVSRQQLRELLDSDEVKGLVAEATKIIYEDMSAEERAELMPVFMRWMEMAKNF